jgi:hypothetical protein
MITLRYLAILPAAVFGFLLAFFVGKEILSWMVIGFCPNEMREGSHCYARWWLDVQDAVIAIFSGIGAILGVSFGALIAPGRRNVVAIIIYLIGFAVASFIAIWSNGFWWSFFSATIMGFLTMWRIANAANKLLKFVPALRAPGSAPL